MNTLASPEARPGGLAVKSGAAKSKWTGLKFAMAFGKPSKPKKRVSFVEIKEDQVYHALAISDMTEEEIENAWYSTEDKARLLVRVHESRPDTAVPRLCPQISSSFLSLRPPRCLLRPPTARL